jgi:hypothetical protein
MAQARLREAEARMPYPDPGPAQAAPSGTSSGTSSCATSSSSAQPVETSRPNFKRQEFFTNGRLDKSWDKALRTLARKIGWRKYRQLRTFGYFEEKGKYGTYRFLCNGSMKTRLIQRISIGPKKRTITWKLCVESKVKLPEPDIMLMRWLEVKADEDRFIKTANFRSVYTCDEFEERDEEETNHDLIELQPLFNE